MKNISKSYDLHMGNANIDISLSTSTDISTEKVVSTNSPNFSKSQLSPIYEKMMNIFTNRFKGYFKDDTEDFFACRVIVEKTEKLKNWAPGSVLNGHMGDFLDFWSKIVEYVASDTWLSGRSLKDLSTREWQRLGQHMSKPPKEPKEPKKGKKVMTPYEMEVQQKIEKLKTLQAK